MGSPLSKKLGQFTWQQNDIDFGLIGICKRSIEKLLKLIFNLQDR